MADKHECNAPVLLDEARLLLLSSRVDAGHATALIAKLRDCAERADSSGDPQLAAAYREAADQIHHRLRSP
jgi:hypothetical protein